MPRSYSTFLSRTPSRLARLACLAGAGRFPASSAPARSAIPHVSAPEPQCRRRVAPDGAAPVRAEPAPVTGAAGRARSRAVRRQDPPRERRRSTRSARSRVVRAGSPRELVRTLGSPPLRAAGPVRGQPHAVLGAKRLSRESPARRMGRPVRGHPPSPLRLAAQFLMSVLRAACRRRVAPDGAAPLRAEPAPVTVPVGEHEVGLSGDRTRRRTGGDRRDRPGAELFAPTGRANLCARSDRCMRANRNDIDSCLSC